MYVKYNPNPQRNSVGDCVIRAICRVTGDDWYHIYAQLAIEGFLMCDMPSANAVWGSFLKRKGFRKIMIPDDITVEEFCQEHSHGSYILGTGSHALAVIDGDYYDSWESGDEMPIYYFCKEDNE